MAQDPDSFGRVADSSGNYRTEQIARVYEEYAKRLKSANAVDFDDIILLAVQRFRNARISVTTTSGSSAMS